MTPLALEVGGPVNVGRWLPFLRTDRPLPAQKFVAEQDMPFGHRTGRYAAVPVPNFGRDRRVAEDGGKLPLSCVMSRRRSA